MKKILFVILGLMIMGGKTFANEQGLPKLNVIKRQMLWAKDGEQFPNLSSGSALYLTGESERSRDPELYIVLMNEGKIYLNSGRQDSYSAIIDLGEESIENFRLSDLYFGSVPGKAVHFTVEPKAKHTYAIILNTALKRGIVLFRVDAVGPREVIFSYTVKAYKTHAQTGASEGEQENGTSAGE